MSAEWVEFIVCPNCKGRGRVGTGWPANPLRDCWKCEGDRIVPSDQEEAARKAARATGASIEDVREMIAKADSITEAAEVKFANALRRDGAVIGTFKTWLDCFAAAQAMSAQFKGALFTADGAMGQHFAYRAGARSRKDEKR